MLVLLSPAMRMKSSGAPLGLDLTTPYFLNESLVLAQQVKSLEFDELAKLLKVSGDAAAQFYLLWQDFVLSKEVNQAALSASALSFDGIAFKHLKACDWSKTDWLYAQDHLRIASGLYGLLRPLDGVQAYRLEMQTRLKTHQAKNLFAFWSTILVERVFEESDGYILNLLSNEYAKALLGGKSHHPSIIEADFKILGKNGYYTQSTWAKIGRGSMVSFVVQNQITDPHDLLEYRQYGFSYSPEMSSENTFVFISDDPYLE